MNLKERSYSVLVVSAAESFNQAMSAMLPEATFRPLYVKSVGSAQRATAEQSFDLVIVNSPLVDDPGVRFAIDSAAKGAVVLLLIRNDIHDEISQRVLPHGVFTLPKPLSRQAMQTALRWMMSARESKRAFEKKATNIEDKMREIRLANKAKWLLISNENMTEPEAHRYLEKEAMNRCISKAEVADEILKKYE